MQLKEENLILNQKFEAKEIMKILICLQQLLTIDDDEPVEEQERIFRLYEGAVTYLVSKFGGSLSKEEQKVVDSFSEVILS